MAELSETSEKKMQQITCENDNCAHYISKRHVHFYKNKFLYIISAASLIFIIIFGLLTYSYNKSQETIVNNYNEYKHEIDSIHHTCQKDTTYSLKQQGMIERIEFQQNSILHQLELQSDSLSSDFTLLSVWAGVLMLVFLIFSIYSVFKTDELMKQSRADIEKIEANSQKANELLESIQKKADKAISEINAVALKESNELKENAKTTIGQIKTEVDKAIVEKTNLFQRRCDDYMTQLKNMKDMFDGFARLFNRNIDDNSNSSEEQEESKR